MAGKRGGRTGNAGIPFEAEKPKYTKRELEFDTRFNERLTNYANHYKEVTGRDCDLGVLIANIVNQAITNDDPSFVQKENSGQFNPPSQNGDRAARTSGTSDTK